MNTFTFNGHTSNEFGIRIERMPVLNRPARKFRAASVPGRNGNIYEFEDAWEEIIQPYEIFAGGMNNGDAVPSFTNIMEWLHSANGYAVLSDTYDSTHYRMAAFVDSADIESQWHTWGRAVINFRCRPEHYLTGQTQAVASGAVINNTTKHIAKPVITLTGGGAQNLLTMENRTNSGHPDGNIAPLPANATSKYYVGVRDDNPGIFASGATFVSAVDSTGTLTFKSNATGYNIKCGIGYTVRVEPDKYYTLSGSYSGPDASPKVVVYCFGNTNSLQPRFIFEGSALNLTFKTPTDCKNIVIAFTAEKHNTQNHVFSSLMLNKGKVKKNFRQYVASVTSVLTIGNTTLTMEDSFATAVIDCDKENVTMDGIDSNTSVTLTDQYGNTSEEYLQLATGNNTITYSGDITACSIDTKMWNL